MPLHDLPVWSGVPSETFRGPRGLRQGVVQDLERLQPTAAFQLERV